MDFFPAREGRIVIFDSGDVTGPTDQLDDMVSLDMQTDPPNDDVQLLSHEVIVPSDDAADDSRSADNLPIDMIDTNNKLSDSYLEVSTPAKPSRTAKRKPRKKTRIKCPCDNCTFSSFYRYGINRHVSTTHDNKKYSCKECSQEYCDKYDLTNHMKCVHHQEAFVCEFCCKLFYSRSGLWKHRRIDHAKDGIYMCNICERQFVSKSDYTGHMNTHFMSKPYDCTACKKSFTFKSSMARHARSCSGVSSIRCDLCQSDFTSTSNLKDHKYAKHGTNRQKYRCFCGKSYPWRSSYNRHKRMTNHALINEGIKTPQHL